MKVAGLFKNAQRVLDVPTGDVVFREGDAGYEMFGVVSGEIQLQSADRVIATLGPDDIFGEMALVDGSPRMATAVAASPSQLVAIDRHRFLLLVQETPMFALSVMATMADRLRPRA
jgi:CRP-like cAMP-binding protein